MPANTWALPGSFSSATKPTTPASASPPPAAGTSPATTAPTTHSNSSRSAPRPARSPAAISATRRSSLRFLDWTP